MELKNIYNSSDAKILLEKLLSYTSIMVKRRSFIFTLAEFFPKDSNLLGINENGNIKIRLRTSKNKNLFYDWEHILGTFIHELAHLNITEHSSDFFKLIEDIDEDVSDDNNNFLNKFKKSKYCSPINTKLLNTGIKLGGI